ncbi:UBA domain-containing protein 3 [Grifola frondosa]|uniref:UBA domain-containing protein 3 n=1 Tax=Grifola frondosa TaxID=5627 RepID=A0A1C7LQF1_GRIFR|nr:UBA domain-containing protein 3 [Grifola frondosa]
MASSFDVCADCKARHPRWASHNLGIFICLPCASIHRKMGTPFRKFHEGQGSSNASNLQPEQRRHPPPTNMMESERDSELEKFIRAKYEYKSFMDRSTQVSAILGPSRSSSGGLSASRSSSSALDASRSAKVAALLGPSRSASSRLSRAQTVPVIRPASQPAPVPPAQAPPQRSQPTSSTPLWNDLASLQAPAANSSLPLQYATPSVSLPALASPNPNTDLTIRPSMAPPMSAMSMNMGGGASPLLPMQSFTPTVASSINPFAQQAAYASQQPTYSPQPAFTPQVQPQVFADVPATRLPDVSITSFTGVPAAELPNVPVATTWAVSIADTDPASPGWEPVPSAAAVGADAIWAAPTFTVRTATDADADATADAITDATSDAAVDVHADESIWCMASAAASAAAGRLPWTALGRNVMVYVLYGLNRFAHRYATSKWTTNAAF